MRFLMPLFASVPVLGGCVLVRCVEGLAWHFAQHAVWFRGARACVADDESESLIDGDFALCESLDRLAGRLKTLRAGLLGRQAAMRHGPSAAALLRTSADLVQEIQTLKTELMEHDADRAPRAEGWTAGTPEEVQTLFARL